MAAVSSEVALRTTPSLSLAFDVTSLNKWGDRRGSNPRQPEPQSGALPTELRPPFELEDIFRAYFTNRQAELKQSIDDPGFQRRFLKCLFAVTVRFKESFPQKSRIRKLFFVFTRRSARKKANLIKWNRSDGLAFYHFMLGLKH